MTDKQFNYIMKHLYDDLCAFVDCYEICLQDGRGGEIDVVASKDIYERLKFYFSKLIDETP